jgi:hypothetical protein
VKNGRAILSILILSLSMAPLLVGGCKSTKKQEPVTPPDTWGHPQTSPQNVIDNLLQAITERDSLHYAAQLADSFRFVFAPQDVGGPNNNPTTWERADEIIAMSRMFGGKANKDDYVCVSVSLSWVSSPADTTADFPSLTRVRETNVFFTVASRNRVTDDPLDYLVQGDQEWLWFEKSGSEWRLIRWEDKPITGTAGFTQPSTFGEIKGLWR